MDEPQADVVESSPPSFWSPWATLGWGVVVMVVFLVAQILVVIAWSAVKLASADHIAGNVLAAEIAANGDVLAVGTLASAIAGGVLVMALSVVKAGFRPRESLALEPPSRAALARWLAVTALLIVVSDSLTVILGRPVVPDFMAELVASVSSHALLWLAVILAAPVFEELFFRGFLIAGLQRGSLGTAGAIVVTSAAWASIHIQYGLYEIVTIFIFGLVLGSARIVGRSLWVPIAMHMTANLVATIEAYVIPGVPG